MAKLSIQDLSRQALIKGTTKFTDPTGYLGFSNEDIQTSALVRIADALEARQQPGTTPGRLCTTFVIPAVELPLLQRYLRDCATVSLLGATSFSVENRPYYDVFLTHCDTADLYNMGRYVGQELEKQEGSQAA